MYNSFALLEGIIIISNMKTILILLTLFLPLLSLPPNYTVTTWVSSF